MKKKTPHDSIESSADQPKETLHNDRKRVSSFSPSHQEVSAPSKAAILQSIPASGNLPDFDIENKDESHPKNPVKKSKPTSTDSKGKLKTESNPPFLHSRNPVGNLDRDSSSLQEYNPAQSPFFNAPDPHLRHSSSQKHYSSSSSKQIPLKPMPSYHEDPPRNPSFYYPPPNIYQHPSSLPLHPGQDFRPAFNTQEQDYHHQTRNFPSQPFRRDNSFHYNSSPSSTTPRNTWVSQDPGFSFVPNAPLKPYSESSVRPSFDPLLGATSRSSSPHPHHPPHHPPHRTSLQRPISSFASNFHHEEQRFSHLPPPSPRDFHLYPHPHPSLNRSEYNPAFSPDSSTFRNFPPSRFPYQDDSSSDHRK
eukprot:Sdes_comp20814_c0_seq2m17236